MLTIIERYHTMREMFEEYNLDKNRRLPGIVTAAAYNRRKKTIVFVVDDGRVFYMNLAGEMVYICELNKSLSSIEVDWNDRLIFTDKNSITRSNDDGSGIHILVDECQGKTFEQIGAASIHSNGMIYFPDCREDGDSAIYFANPIGMKAVCAGTDTSFPTAVRHSVDNNFLYIAESEQGFITKFDILGDGTLKYKRIYCFLDPEHVEAVSNMLVDERDNLFVVTNAGIHVYAPGGMLLGVIATEKPCTAACFGGDKLKTLYIFCRDQLYILERKDSGAGKCS